MIDRERLSRWRTLAFQALFGDRIGLVLFLASLTLFVSLWRTAFLINDSYTIANGLYAVVHGDLSMTVAEYGTLRSPGANLYQGRIYSRNYGVIVLSLPLLVLFRAVGAVADLRVALIAAWSLLLFATTLQVGRLLDRRRTATVSGGAVVLVLFVANVALARPLDAPPYHLLALQTLHMTAAAFVGPTAYRLVSAQTDRQVGVSAGLLVVTATPLALWASVPKRHVLTAAVVLALALSLTDSRRESAWAFESRASGYILVALLAWVHAPEALIVFVPFVVVDVATAPNNDPRTLASLGLLFLLASLPMLVTNTLLTGDPLTVPRMLRDVSPGADISLSGGTQADSGDFSAESQGSGWVLPAILVAPVGLVRSALEPLLTLAELVSKGCLALFTQQSDVYHTLLRSGYVGQLESRTDHTIAANLTLLESTPILSTVVVAVSAATATATRTVRERSLARQPAPSTLFLLAATIMFTLVYLARLPLHAQITVRYLFPAAPALVCLFVQYPPVRRALAVHWRTMVWSVASGVLIGGQLVVTTLVALDVGRAEAFQFHALLGLTVASGLAGWCLLGSLTDRVDRVGAALLGLAAAATTVFVCLATVEYFGLGGAHALPLARVVADLLPLR